MARVNLTDARIKALKPDPTGRTRPELRDALVPGLIVRIAAKRKTFMLHARFPGAKHPTRRAIGEVGAVSLDAARAIARRWYELMQQGVDPAAEARRREHEERAAREAEAARDDCSHRPAAGPDWLRRRAKAEAEACRLGG
jgi:hypothetical protein